MAGFEVSDAPARVNDPFKIVGEMAQTQNALNQNKLFQAQTIAGHYLSQSLDENGQPDPVKFGNKLYADPRTAPYAAEALHNQRVIQQGGIANTQAQTNLVTSQYNNIRDDNANAYAAAYTAAKSTDPNGDPKSWDAAGTKASIVALTKGAQLGRYSPDQVARYTGNGEFNTNTSRAALISGQGGAGAPEAVFGKSSIVDVGGQQKSVLTSPASGTVTAMTGNAADLQNTPSPNTLIQRTPVLGPNNQPESVSLGSIAPGPVATQAAPGAAEAQAAVAKTGSDQIAELRNSFKDTKTREALLDEMTSALPDFRAGKLSSKTSDLITNANQLLGLNLSPTATPSQQVFNKLAEAYATRNREITGLSNSDMQTLLSKAQSPNTDISNEAVKQLVAMGKGGEKLVQLKSAMTDDWLDQSKHGAGAGRPENYQNFVSQFNSKLDPRVFQEPYMTPQQRQQMYKSMTPTQLKQFNESKATAARLVKQYGINF